MKNLKRWKVLGVLLSACLVGRSISWMSGGTRQVPEGKGEYETLTIRYEGSVGTVTYPELAEDLGYLEPT